MATESPKGSAGTSSHNLCVRMCFEMKVSPLVSAGNDRGAASKDKPVSPTPAARPSELACSQVLDPQPLLPDVGTDVGTPASVTVSKGTAEVVGGDGTILSTLQPSQISLRSLRYMRKAAFAVPSLFWRY